MKKIAHVFAVAALVCMLLPGKLPAQTPWETIGEVGGGFFLPTGADRDVAGPSPALQVAMSIGFSPHLSAEAEFLYAHFLLRRQALSAFAQSSGGQIAGVAGIRVTTSGLIGTTRPVVGYLSLRAGFAREKVRATAPSARPTPPSPDGSWIGRSVDAIKSPGTAPGQKSSDRQWGSVLSPKTGVLLRISRRAAVDLAFYPVFIFHRRTTTTQAFLTVGIVLASWETF